MSVFPPTGFVGKEDSKYYTMTQADPAVKPKDDWGYNYARARSKRRPRRTFTTGFTSIREADRLLLEEFWNTVKGGSVAFDWTLPDTGEVVRVRFADKMTFKYAGYGDYYAWDVANIKLEEV